MSILSDISLPRLIKIRRDLHKIPELGFNEHRTSGYIKDILKGMGAEYHEVAGTGIIAVFKGKGSYGTIAYRTDMDGLEIEEKTDCDFSSENQGVMHACGHDGHMAMALELCHVLNGLSGNHKYDFAVIFQPAEEGPGGAIEITKTEIYKELNIKEVYGYHIYPDLKMGQIGFCSGEFMAMPVEFDISIKGKSAHGAKPHQGVDSIVAASELVMKLQTIVSRVISPLDSAVLTIGKINGGEMRNVIAGETVLNGTMRVFSESVYAVMKETVLGHLEALEKSYGVSTSWEFRKMSPPVVNDSSLSDKFSSLSDSYTHTEKVMLAEDFSYYQKDTKGLFMFLGSSMEDGAYSLPLHNPSFNFDEKVLEFGVKEILRYFVMRGFIDEN